MTKDFSCLAGSRTGKALSVFLIVFAIWHISQRTSSSLGSFHGFHGLICCEIRSPCCLRAVKMGKVDKIQSITKNGCIMYCFSAGFRNFVRGECHADERILQIEKKYPVTPELLLSDLVENARCMSLRMCSGNFSAQFDM